MSGAAVSGVPSVLDGIKLELAGVPGNIDRVKVAIPAKIGTVTKFQDRFNLLNRGLAMGIRAKQTTNILIPPYVKGH